MGTRAGLQQVAAAVAEITDTRQPRLTAGVLRVVIVVRLKITIRVDPSMMMKIYVIEIIF